MRVSSAVTFALLLALAQADVYMQNPLGSNNRMFRDRANDPNNNEVQNANRLFDSQDNNRGGYDWHGGSGTMGYYEGSVLGLEWTLQHGCGSGEGAVSDCEIIWQYMCGVDVRDGSVSNTIPFTEVQSQSTQYGMHEDYYFYRDCTMRQRNMGLFLADQDENINGDTAVYTRQNPNNNDPHGFECPEERDYYPYWHWTPWTDIVVFASDTSRCSYYQTNSQNNAGTGGSRGYCYDAAQNSLDAFWYNNQADCTNAGYTWGSKPGWGIAPPECLAAPFTRENYLGNARQELHPEDPRLTQSGIDNPRYNWTIPSVSTIETLYGTGAAANCVVRIRYNMSSTDYDGWNTDSASNGKLKSEVINDPWFNYNWEYLLRLAVNTAQFGRTFQDRSHIFRVLPRPSSVAVHTRSGAEVNNQVRRQSTVTWTASTYSMSSYDKIHNLNIIGRRGRLQDSFPAEQYGFRPRIVVMNKGEFLHPQWTGSDYAPVNVFGEGATSTDRHCIIQIPSLTENYPYNVSEGTLFEPHVAWGLAFAGIYDSNGNPQSSNLIGPDLTYGQYCPTLGDLQDRYRTSAGLYNWESIRTDAYNCMKISGTKSPRYDAGLIQMNSAGVYYAMDARNNVPGLATVKVTIVVLP
jgi:hypothetical protein